MTRISKLAAVAALAAASVSAPALAQDRLTAVSRWWAADEAPVSGER